MSCSDGARSARKFGTKSPKKLCVTKSENGDKTTTTISHCTNHRHTHHYHHGHHRFLDGTQPSVHKRNLYIVSFPLILLFNVLRTLLYQLFVVFKYLYSSTSQLIQRRQASKQACQLEIVVGQRHLADGRLINSNRVDGEVMSQVPRRPMGPGPGDPLLAKQKHHHRRAFEYISKALKIDEDNEGQKEMAIELYKKGIGELEKGIAVECNGGHGEVWEHAQRLHDKMCTNLAMAKDRLDFLVSVRELRKLGINGNINNRAPGNKTDGEHPGKHLRARRNAHTFQTARTSSNISHNKNTNNIHTTINAGQTMCTQIPKLRPRSPKNCFAHTTEGIVRLRFWA